MAGLGSGELDRDIVLLYAQPVQSTSGEALFDWDHAREIPVAASWMPIGTREAWQAQQRLNAYVDGVFRIYDISPRPTPEGTRIKWDNRTFDIKPYVEIGRAEGLAIPVVGRED